MLITRFLALTALLLLASPACRSARKKTPARSPELAALSDDNPRAQVFGYYRLKKTMNGFYYNLPTFVDVLPDKYLGRRHVIQLLSANVSEGWARVKKDDGQLGYVRHENIRFVAPEDQPRPRYRDTEAEIDKLMDWGRRRR